MNLNVKEIFYSLQGEGGRQGEASIFIRLAGCNMQCAFCDTDFSGGEAMSVNGILDRIRPFPCRWIVWTGGEPTLQLTDDVLLAFKRQGYLSAIESNGSRRLPALLDYATVSPKGLAIEYARRLNPRVDEVRLPLRDGETPPPLSLLPEARHYFLSPVFSDDPAAVQANIAHCVACILRRPEWRLSLQMHKLAGFA